MNQFCKLTAVLLVGSFLSGFAVAEEALLFDAEIADIDSQIADVDATIGRFESGLIRSLAEARREALLLLRTVLQIRKQAESGEVTTEFTVPVVKPDPVLAKQLLGEMAAQQQRIEAAEMEASAAGGLIKAIALGRLETEKLTLAQLQMSYVQERYGIAFPKPAHVGTIVKNADDPEIPGANSKDKFADAIVPWADAAHPEIDYTLPPFKKAHEDGDRISGWWVIKEERAAIDDSPRVTAINYSAYKERSFSDLTVLVAYCREGETSFVFVQDDYLMKNRGRDEFDIAYRIDDKSAQSTYWSGLTSNKGAGIFGSNAEPFLRKIYDAKEFFIRLTEGNGRRHDAEFELAGTQNVVDAVASACGWSTLDLTQDDYRTIQSLLNAGGFNAGTPDGIWGESSKDALRSFQEQSSLPPTGALDKTTLKALGVKMDVMTAD